MIKNKAFPVAGIDVVQREALGEGGFFELLRCQLRNRRVDGSCSARYALDVLVRPGRPDAVVVLAYQTRPLRVLLRDGLRPALRVGRAKAPLRDGGEPPLTLVEAVAGVLEAEDVGPAGLRRRAQIELREETGLEVTAEAIEILGPPTYLSPGAMAEQLHFCAVEAPIDRRGTAAGDGSAMEEGSAAVTVGLVEALSACAEGVIADLKTECALRRLAARLVARGVCPSIDDSV